MRARRSAAYGGTHEDTEGFDDMEWLGARGVDVRVVGVTVWAAAESGVVHGLQTHYLLCDARSCTTLDGPKHLKVLTESITLPVTTAALTDPRTPCSGAGGGWGWITCWRCTTLLLASV